MIRQRVRAGLSVIKEKIARDGKFVSKAGKVRRKLGRPGAEPDKIELARRELAKGLGIGKVAREVGLELSPAQPCRALLQQAQAVSPHCHPLPPFLHSFSLPQYGISLRSIESTP
jgi:hypothetical protein